MHRKFNGLWPGTEDTKVTTELLGRIEGGTEVRICFGVFFQHIEISDTGGPSNPNYLQQRIGNSGKVGTTGSLRTPGGKSWVWMVGG